MLLTRRQFLTTLLKRAALGGAGFSAVVGGAMLAQAYAPAQLNTHRAGLRGLTAPLRVALLSDLHHGPLIGLRQVRGWIDKAMSLQADVVLLLGDFVDLDLGSAMPGAFLDELARLRAPLGVWGVWGNHDYASFGRKDPAPSAPDWPSIRERFAAELGARGIQILREEGVLLRPDVFLGGVDDLYFGQPDAAMALRHAPAGAARVMMSHNPDYLAHAPPRFDLMLSGHTHGGQVRLPLVGALVVPSQYGQRFAQGWITSGDLRGFVSRGLGLTTLPFRNLCPSEIVLLDLSPVSSSRARSTGLGTTRIGLSRQTLP